MATDCQEVCSPSSRANNFYRLTHSGQKKNFYFPGSVPPLIKNLWIYVIPISGKAIHLTFYENTGKLEVLCIFLAQAGSL